MTEHGTDVFARLTAALAEAGISFRRIQHRPAYTSAEAAAVRGTPLHSGAKALVLKGGKSFVMAVMPADLSLDGRALCKLLRCKRLRFAYEEEVLDITGLTPGSIPPFGSLFALPTLCDERLSENQYINFSAGSHSNSIRMSYVDYIAFESPRIGRVARPPDYSSGL